jgi:prefoldin alpha subunit
MTQDPNALLQRLYAEQQMLESNIQVMQESIQLVQSSLNSYRTGLEVLEEIEKREEDEVMLINIGGAVFVEAKLVNIDKVTRGIGSGVRIEQSLGEAKKHINDRVEMLEKRLSELRDDYEDTLVRAQAINNQMQQLAAQVQMQQQQPQQQEE